MAAQTGLSEENKKACTDAYDEIDALLTREDLTLAEVRAALETVDELPDPVTDNSGRLTVGILTELRALNRRQETCVRRLQARMQTLSDQQRDHDIAARITAAMTTAMTAQRAAEDANRAQRQQEMEANITRSLQEAIRTSIASNIQETLGALASTPGGVLNAAVDARLHAFATVQEEATRASALAAEERRRHALEMEELKKAVEEQDRVHRAKVSELEKVLKGPSTSNTNPLSSSSTMPSDSTAEQIIATTVANALGNALSRFTREADNHANPYFKAEYPTLDDALHPDPQTWVEALEAIFLTVERTSRPNADGTPKTMTDTAKVAIATCRLNSVALDWWNTFKLDEAGIAATHDWRRFSKELLAELQPADIKERYHNQYLATKFTGHPGHYATQLLQLARRIGQSVPRLAISPSQLVKKFIDGLKEAEVKYPHAGCEKMVSEILREEDSIRVATNNPNYSLTIQVARRAAMRQYSVTQLANLRKQHNMNPFNVLSATDPDDADDGDYNMGANFAAAYTPSPPAFPAPSSRSRPSVSFSVPPTLHAMGTRGGNGDEDDSDEPGGEWDDALCQMAIRNSHVTRLYSLQDARSKGISCYICGQNHLMRDCPQRDKRLPVSFRRNQRRGMGNQKRRRGVKPELAKRFKDPMSRRTRFFRRDGQAANPRDQLHFSEVQIDEPEDLLEAISSLDANETLWMADDSGGQAHCWVMDDECVSLYWTAHRE